MADLFLRVSLNQTAREIPVLKEDEHYLFIENKGGNPLAIRKPISLRWNTRSDHQGKLIAIQLKAGED